MGTKRVGLARTQALLENLKRELQMNNASFNGVQRTLANGGTAITADHDLSQNDVGSLVLIDASSSGNFTITLPSPVAGMTFEFVTINDHHAAAQVLLDADSGVKIQGMTIRADGSTFAQANHDNQKLGFDDATKRGGRIKITCYSSTRWIIQAAEASKAFITAFD